jgi:hypothetical protein
MVRSATDDDRGTAPPKPIRKSWTMESIPATDKDFLEWRKDQYLLSHGLGVREAMVVYVEQLNFESSERYELKMKEHKAWILSSKSRDTEENPEQSNEPEPAKMKAPDGNIMNTLSP